MEILQKYPNYPEAAYVAESMGEYVEININAPGYTLEDLTIESRDTGVTVVGNPNKKVAGGKLVKGFKNFYPFDDPKKFDRAKISASIYNGVLTLQVPVAEEFRAVKISIKNVIV